MKGERKLTKWQREHLKEVGIKTVSDFMVCLAHQKKMGLPCIQCDAIAEKLAITKA